MIHQANRRLIRTVPGFIRRRPRIRVVRRTQLAFNSHNRINIGGHSQRHLSAFNISSAVTQNNNPDGVQHKLTVMKVGVGIPSRLTILASLGRSGLIIPTLRRILLSSLGTRRTFTRRTRSTRNTIRQGVTTRIFRHYSRVTLTRFLNGGRIVPNLRVNRSRLNNGNHGHPHVNFRVQHFRHRLLTRGDTSTLNQVHRSINRARLHRIFVTRRRHFTVPLDRRRNRRQFVIRLPNIQTLVKNTNRVHDRVLFTRNTILNVDRRLVAHNTIRQRRPA